MKQLHLGTPFARTADLLFLLFLILLPLGLCITSAQDKPSAKNSQSRALRQVVGREREVVDERHGNS
jgi:hypothetical protein